MLRRKRGILATQWWVSSVANAFSGCRWPAAHRCAESCAWTARMVFVGTLADLGWVFLLGLSIRGNLDVSQDGACFCRKAEEQARLQRGVGSLYR